MKPMSSFFMSIKRCTAALALGACAVVQASPWQASDVGLLTGRNNLFVRDVNSAGQIAGFAYASSDSVFSAFLGDHTGLQDIGALGTAQFGYVQSTGLKLNEQGQLVGNANLGSGAGRAWRYSQGQLQDLGTLGGNYNRAAAINASGQVAGVSYPAGSTSLSLFVSNGSTTTNLGNLGGNYLEVAAINDRGWIIGTANKGTSLSRAYVAPFGTTVMELQTARSTSTHSFAADINNNDQVVGWLRPVDSDAPHAALSTPDFGLGPFYDIHDQVSLGGGRSQASAINDAGDIVGWASLSDDQRTHAFLLRGAGGTVLDLGTLGGSWSWALGVNALGQVVGESAQADGKNSWFVYRDGHMTDLQNEVALLYGLLGEPTVVYATLSDAGHVAGTVLTADGEYRGFLLSPVPEPGSVAMLLAGLALLLWRRRPGRSALVLATAGAIGAPALADDAPPWARIELRGQISWAESLVADPVSFDLASWRGRPFQLSLTLPASVQLSGQVPVDEVPGAVASKWQMAWIDSNLRLGIAEQYSARAYSFQGVSTLNGITIPAGLDLGGTGLVAGRTYDILSVSASELGQRCANPGTDGVCSGYFNHNDDPLNGGGTDPIEALYDPSEAWEGLTVEWEHTWDTAQHVGLGGSSYPALPALTSGTFDLSQGWGALHISVWRVTGDATGRPIAFEVAEAYGTVDMAAIQAVPEPATHALLLAGLGLVSCITRLRRATPGNQFD